MLLGVLDQNTHHYPTLVRWKNNRSCYSDSNSLLVISKLANNSSILPSCDGRLGIRMPFPPGHLDRARLNLIRSIHCIPPNPRSADLSDSGSEVFLHPINSQPAAPLILHLLPDDHRLHETLDRPRANSQYRQVLIVFAACSVFLL